MATTQYEAAILEAIAAEEKQKVSIWVKIRPIYPFLFMAAVWEISAASLQGQMGSLMPTLGDIAMRAWELLFGPLIEALQDNPHLGLMGWISSLSESPILRHTAATAWRLPLSFAFGAIIGIVIGILMGRYSFWEAFFVPLIAVLLPIPALAWTPIVVLWSGFGDGTVIIVWTGVKTVNPVWLRAAESMNADKMTIFRTVVLPGSLPMVMSGLRIGLARAWRAGVAAEAFAGIRWGLSAGIFDAQEYLDIAFMMVAIAVLGLFGYVLEKVMFQPIENRTVIKWGMMEAMGGQGRRN